MSRYDLSRAQLAEVLGDVPVYRTAQLHDGLYLSLAEPAELTALPRPRGSASRSTSACRRHSRSSRSASRIAARRPSGSTTSATGR